MSINIFFLDLGQSLCKCLSFLYQKMALHPDKTDLFLEQVEFNLDCLKHLIHSYPEAFSMHSQGFLIQMSKSHKAAKKKQTHSLLLTLSHQARQAIEELKPETSTKFDLIPSFDDSAQLKNLIMNVNTLVGFLYISTLKNDKEDENFINDLIIKLLNLSCLYIALAPSITDKFPPSTKQLLDSTQEKVFTFLNKGSFSEKSLLNLTDYLINLIKKIKIKQSN